MDETPAMRQVKLVRVFSDTRPGVEAAALVEWMIRGDYKRVMVPRAELVETEQRGFYECSEEVLEAGLPYGVDWEKLIKCSATPLRIAKVLRRRGIWTVADLHEQASHSRKAFTRFGDQDFGALLGAVKTLRNQED